MKCSHTNTGFAHYHYYDGMYQYIYSTYGECLKKLFELHRDQTCSVVELCLDCNKILKENNTDC